MGNSYSYRNSPPIEYLENSLLDQAIKFAEKYHNGQIRKFNGIPYITHPLSVVKYLNFFKSSKNKEILLVSAVCHDLLEDTEVTIELIREKFGDMVASIVIELTNDRDLISKMGKTNYLKEKMAIMSSYALGIKLCDRLDNLSDLGIAPTEFCEKYTKQSTEILDHIEVNRTLTGTHKNIIFEIRNLINQYTEIEV